jgi:N-acetylneuraminic acid mutarotase
MNMPTPRSEIAATNIEGNIFVIGGFDESGKALATVESYNVFNDSWKSITPLPEPMHHTTASTYNGKIFVVGGFTSDVGDWVPTNKLFIYDPLKQEWKEGKPMPTARGALTATFVNGILFAIGGQKSSDIVSSDILNTNEAYDPNTDTWTKKASMPTSRHHAASSAIDGKIYVIGGRAVANSSMINLNVNELYNPVKNEWVSLEHMPSKRSGIAAASYNNTIYVLGGEDAGGQDPKTYSNNENFNPAADTWSSKESLPTPRHGLTATTVDNNIFVIGGGPKAGLSVSNVNEVFKLK